MCGRRSRYEFIYVCMCVCGGGAGAQEAHARAGPPRPRSPGRGRMDLFYICVCVCMVFALIDGLAHQPTDHLRPTQKHTTTSNPPIQSSPPSPLEKQKQPNKQPNKQTGEGPGARRLLRKSARGEEPARVGAGAGAAVSVPGGSRAGGQGGAAVRLRCVFVYFVCMSCGPMDGGAQPHHTSIDRGRMTDVLNIF